MRIDWLLYAPQYHFAMAVLVIVCLVLLVSIYLKLRFICQLIGTCPLCGKNTLYTVQTCLKCKFIRTHANKLPGEVRCE